MKATVSSSCATVHSEMEGEAKGRIETKGHGDWWDCKGKAEAENAEQATALVGARAVAWRQCQSARSARRVTNLKVASSCPELLG
jgi:hypothetical protein